MNKKWCPLPFVFCCLLLVSCSGKKPATGEVVIATIGKEAITFSEIKQAAEGLNRLLKENFETSKEWRTDFIRQYVARTALAKRAKREGLEKDRDIVFSLEQARRGILAEKLLERKLGKIEAREEDLLRYYEANKGKYEKKPFEKVKDQVSFEYNKKLKDEAVNRFIMDTFVEEKVKMNEEAIANVKP